MKKKHSTQSHIDPSRETVGKIYTDAQKRPTRVVVGDLTGEFMNSLVEDINSAIESKPFGDDPFYICIYEKKDLQMRNAVLRRLYTSRYRPYPEDDTLVFHVDPVNGEVRFCWCLPHWSEMDNIMMNITLFDSDLVRSISEWKKLNLEPFGFVKDSIGNWVPNPKWQDTVIN